MPINTLAAIQTKVRRLTRSPSTAQLSDTELNNYINTFVVYDMAEQLRQFINKTTVTFYCNPFQDAYPTNIVDFGGATNASNNILYNFQNKYLTVNPPVYIAGYNSYYTQSREEFYGIYPQLSSINNAGYGDGVTTQFTGVINTQFPGQPPPQNNLAQQICLVKGEVLFSSVDVNGNGLAMVDIPVLDQNTGNPTIYGQLYAANNIPTNPDGSINYPLASIPYVVGTNISAANYINYVTGAFTVTFATAPASGETINSQTVPQIVSLPQTLLYYNNTFYLRPIPDQPYAINIEAYIRPTELLATNQAPQLQEWWQYISYGSSRKIFQDRMDMDSVALIDPEFREQERLCLRRTLVQLSNQRTPTIYTQQTGLGTTNGFGWGWGSSGF